MSKVRGVVGLLGSVAGASKAVTDVRAARAKNDKLLLANAIAMVVVVITGGGIAFRDLRKDLKK